MVDVALGRSYADVVLRGGKVVSTPTGEIIESNLAVCDDTIALLGDCERAIGPDTQVIECAGRFLLPGFIDGHLHPENSRLSPGPTADLLITAGTTSIVTGLDHTVAAAGLTGLRQALDDYATTGLRVFWTSPFRLPYTTPPSTTPYPWGPDEQSQVMDWPECIGVWELCPGFIEIHDSATLAAIEQADRRRLGVYGSVPAAGDDTDLIAAHVAGGLRIDHEAYGEAELLAKLRLGLNALVRDSPVENFLPRLISIVNEKPELAHLIGFCTDEFIANEVKEHGHLGRLIREAVRLGVPAITAVQMATINTARAYGVDSLVGSLTPGRRADVVICDDLVSFRPISVLAAGRLVANDGIRILGPSAPPGPGQTPGPFDRPSVTPEDFAIEAQDESMVDGQHVAVTIEMTPNAFHRIKANQSVQVIKGKIQLDPTRDIAGVAYVNRHRRTSISPALGLVTGFGLRTGALATSSTPDDENILCVGTNPRDMSLAVNEVIRRGGADIVVSDGEVIAVLDLPVHGIMSDLGIDGLIHQQAMIINSARSLGCELVDPMMFLGLLAITGTPEIGMSEYGPIDYATRAPIPLLVPSRPTDTT